MMSYLAIPTLKTLIKPAFDSADNVESLSISLTLESPQVQAGSSIAVFPTAVKNILFSSKISFLKAIDGEGVLPVALRDYGSRWTAERSTSGDVTMSYVIAPSSKSAGSPYDLCCDQGGVLGCGLHFFPTFHSAKVSRNIVAWDLTQAPEGTRAVWTFGEGPVSVEKVGPGTILSDSVYMVGRIHSNPSTPIPGSVSDYYGYYWFAKLPPNIEVIKDIHQDFLVKVSTFFQDPLSASNPYRSFVRNTSSTNSFGGTSFTRSSIFSYDSRISSAHDYDLIRRLAYEIIHTFLGPPTIDPEIDWLFEGIKNTLSIYLPFRTSFRTAHYFQHTMAMQCMKYYTNPLISLNHEEALELAPTNEYARELISARAWAFVILTDFRSRVVAEEKRKDLLPRPVEDMAVKPLASKRRNGEPHGIEQWIELLKPLMGNEVRKLYEQMLSGAKIVLPERFFGPTTHLMKSVQLEMLSFGTKIESLEEGFVKGLEAGSRAEMAGLREGDKIVRTSPVWKCVDHFEAEMELVIERGGVEQRVVYWPRSVEKVECLKFTKIDEK